MISSSFLPKLDESFHGFKGEHQRDYFEKTQSSMIAVGIKFAYSFDTTGSQDARHIVTDTGWKVSLDRGLDIFQQYDVNDAFSLSTRLQSTGLVRRLKLHFKSWIVICDQLMNRYKAIFLGVYC